MKYNQTKYKLRTIWNKNEINKNNIEIKYNKYKKIKNIYINKYIYSIKKFYIFNTDWQYIQNFEVNSYYYIQWNIEFSKFLIKFVPYIKSAILIKYPEDISPDVVNIPDYSKINEIVKVENLDSKEYQRIVYIVGYSLQLNINIQVKLLVQITNPEFYI